VKAVRIYCPVCQVRFPLAVEPAEGLSVVCPVCGQTLTLSAGPEGSWEGIRPQPGTEAELRARIEEFARQRGFGFGEMKEEIVDGLIAKARLFGDCYCPCRLIHEPAYLCPCRPTRGGDVLVKGQCHCGLFVKLARPAV
jgi:ferredoxin-thioredoxin reductase catalytic subunit